MRRLSLAVSTKSFDSSAGLASVGTESLCIAVQNVFSRDWLKTYYLDVLGDAVQKVFSRRLRVDFRVDPELLVEAAKYIDIIKSQQKQIPQAVLAEFKELVGEAAFDDKAAAGSVSAPSAASAAAIADGQVDAVERS